MNAQIAIFGTVVRGITTAVVYEEGEIVIRCTTDSDLIALGIRLLSNSNNAAASLGFDLTQTVGVFEVDGEGGAVGGDLDLVAVNTFP